MPKKGDSKPKAEAVKRNGGKESRKEGGRKKRWQEEMRRLVTLFHGDARNKKSRPLYLNFILRVTTKDVEGIAVLI
ncbi:hypothetical protein OUZ56_004497 [Daphnia magna]|uniref:Uncharacterized protein n=1 Tax=Daphnia magna TaxID=35525 RepID=A0ABQ9YPZ5_9CRUS|nr:hypothetical protein OUZ56_004497 [Daphnia magna]